MFLQCHVTYLAGGGGVFEENMSLSCRINTSRNFRDKMLLLCHVKHPGVSDGDCGWRLPMETADGDCGWRLPMETADGDCRWRLPMETADGDCRWRLDIVYVVMPCNTARESSTETRCCPVGQHV